MKYIYKIVLYIKNRRNIVYTKYKCEKSGKMTCYMKGWSHGFVIIEAMSHVEVFIPDEKKDYHEDGKDGEIHCLYYHKTRLQ